jgi:signal peptidase I
MSIYMIITITSFLAFIAGLWKIFEKAGYKGWMAVVPFYNFYIWLKLINKPIWWYVFLIIPFINVFTILLMVVETLKCFRKEGIGEQALGVLFPFLFFPYLGFAPKEEYTHPTQLPLVFKSATREWAEAIIFAVIAAVIIRTFLVEAYTIPTSSMEKSLLVGDYLFVSKISYGPKIPNTPIAFPFAHNTMPLTKFTPSYTDLLQLPYYRYPGIRSISNNDVVVFNYPDGDTVALQMQNQSYYALVRDMGRDAVWRHYDVTHRPVDRRMNYIKRCVGIPGDTLKIVHGQIFINGELLQDPQKTQHNYQVITDGSPLTQRLIDRFDISDWGQISQGVYMLAMTSEAATQVETIKNVMAVNKMIRHDGVRERYIFPHNPEFAWNEDYFGPLYIPAKGATIEINSGNIALYERIIGVYEKNQLEIKGDDIFINGEKADTYTFLMDYYWMMGDNRHNSADSRFWGFVPEDHIVGRAMFVWLSIDRTKRFLNMIRLKQTFRRIR